LLLKQCTAEESVRAAEIKSRESEEKLKAIRGNIELVAALPAFGALSKEWINVVLHLTPKCTKTLKRHTQRNRKIVKTLMYVQMYHRFMLNIL
jgi:hypothetical protein